MTQIRLAPSGPGPATHALVIGVGYYRHLLGGPEQKPRVHLGLSVLESPPRSAEKFANVLLGTDPASPGLALHNPAAPLATLEVLISGRNPSTFAVGATTHVAEAATSDAVALAFDRWLAEVEGHPDNVGILYFCGHGVMGNGPEQYLLLEDHGRSANRPFEAGSFDFTSTLRALWRRVPAQLYAFVDACRTHDARVAGTMGARPGPLLEETASTRNVNLGSTLVEASGEGLPAYGDGAGVSRFTDALVRALDGYCGVPQPGSGQWLVNGEAISQAMPKLLALVNRERQGEAQSCTPHPSGPRDLPLHVLVRPPKVKVEIVVLPEKYQPLGGFTMSDLLDRAAPPLVGGNMPGEWRTEAVRGFYRIEVRSPTRAFADFEGPAESVDPPTYRLQVSR
jgi:hypothetical protein